jgi:hypothetical protein
MALQEALHGMVTPLSLQYHSTEVGLVVKDKLMPQ